MQMKLVLTFLVLTSWALMVADANAEWTCGTTTDKISGKQVATSYKYVKKDELLIFERMLGCNENRRKGTPTGSGFQEGGSGSPATKWRTCSDPTGICTGVIWEQS